MISALSVVPLLAGCVSIMDVVGVPRAGYQPNGKYVLNNEEEKLACRQIKARLEVLDRDLQAFPQKAALERDTVPKTVGYAVGRMFGGDGGGLKATSDYQRAQAENEALKELLGKKHCV